MSEAESAFEKVLEEDGEDSYSFQQLMDALTENGDIILTIPRDQVESLRKGLSVVKAKRNAKLKSAGLAAPADVISYQVYDDKETEKTADTKVRIKLGPRTGVHVKKLELPDDTI